MESNNKLYHLIIRKDDAEFNAAFVTDIPPHLIFWTFKNLLGAYYAYNIYGLSPFEIFEKILKKSKELECFSKMVGNVRDEITDKSEYLVSINRLGTTNSIIVSNKKTVSLAQQLSPTVKEYYTFFCKDEKKSLILDILMDKMDEVLFDSILIKLGNGKTFIPIGNNEFIKFCTHLRQKGHLGVTAVKIPKNSPNYELLNKYEANTDILNLDSKKLEKFIDELKKMRFRIAIGVLRQLVVKTFNTSIRKEHCILHGITSKENIKSKFFGIDINTGQVSLFDDKLNVIQYDTMDYEDVKNTIRVFSKDAIYDLTILGNGVATYL